MLAAGLDFKLTLTCTIAFMQIHIEDGRSSRPPARRAIYCDGSHDAAFRDGVDIELSHWIPNRTPPRYRADTSTAICAAFVADAGRDRGFELAINNHLDVDGVLALYVVARGAAVLAERETLVQAAEIGDFWGCGEAPAQALFEALVAILRGPERVHEAGTSMALRCFARIDAVLAGAPVPEAVAGMQALAAARARIDGGAVERTPHGRRFVHYRVPQRLAEAELADWLVVQPFGQSLASAGLLAPQARARLDGERVQLLSVESAAGTYHDLWYPGYAWAETPQRWRLPGLAHAGSSNEHTLDFEPLRAAARDLAADERGRGEWRVATTLTPFDALAGRGFPVVMSFVDGNRPAPSSIPARDVAARLADVFGALA
jgi:hypothetical protein